MWRIRLRASALANVGILCVLIVGLQTATAQAGSATRMSSVKPVKADPDKTRKVVRKYAACVVHKQRPLASAFVLDRSTLDFQPKYKSLNQPDCLVDVTKEDDYDEIDLHMAGDSVRFALAEALLSSEIGLIDPAGLPSAAPLPLPPISINGSEMKTKSVDERSPDRRSDGNASILYYRFGECVVRANPRSALNLLSADEGSDDEKVAFAALTPTLGACLEKGAQLKLDRTVLRGSIAFSYYSLAHAAQASSPSSTQ